MPITLSSQKNVFEMVTWGPANGVNGRFSARNVSSLTQTFTGFPTGHVHTGKPFWEFEAELSTTHGLRINNAVVRDTQGTGSTEKVCKRIEFTDLRVTFTDNTSKDISFSRAFSHANSVFLVGENGKKRTDDLYQRGVSLKLVDDMDGDCRAEVELSAVFRGELNDGDPGGAFDGFKFYPQISFTWHRLPGSSKKVKSFRGNIKMLVDVHMPAGHHGSMSPANIASFYTDSNASLSATDTRNKSFHYQSLLVAAATGGALTGGAISSFLAARVFPPGALPAAAIGAFVGGAVGGYAASHFPDWAIIFDNGDTDLQNEKEIQGLYGPLDGNNPDGDSYFYNERSTRYDWPAGSLVGSINLVKKKRQGYYDNIHVHGKMHQQTRRGDEHAHAPFCVHSCVHLHWRWSDLNASIAGMASHPDPSAFMGWAWHRRSNSWRASSRPGAPLIPPNQSLKIAVTGPSATMSSSGQVANSSQSLQSDEKMIWYMVEVQKGGGLKFPAGEKQVFMEHGIGYAYRFAVSRLPPLPAPLSGLPQSAIQSMLGTFFHYFYQAIRYFDGDLPAITDEVGQQIPSGTYTEGGNHPSMELL